MEIRRATIDDAYYIENLIVNVWKTAYRGIVSDDYLNSYNENTERRKESFSDLNTNHYITISDSSIVGYIKGYPCKDEELLNCYEIGACYVANGIQSLGIGKRLFDHLVSKLNPADWDQIVVWTLKESDRSVGFYESLGFVKDGKENELNFGEFLTVVRLIKDIKSTV